MHLELDGRGARYAQLARSLKSAIFGGQLKPGSRLPPTRELAVQLGLSRNTVLTAYEILCAEQLAQARGGSGTYVTATAVPEAPRRASEPVPAQSRYAARLRQLPPSAFRRYGPRARYDLQYGEPLLDLPLITAWRRHLTAATSRARLHYPAAQGLRDLREAICEHVARRRGIVCDADDVVIVSGTQQAVTLLARVLVDDGDTVAIEEPRYQLAASALQAHGARLLAVPTDVEGIDCSALPPNPPRFVYVTPSHQFPSGVEMSLARRLALLRYAREQGCWIVEDDYDGEFRYAPRSTPALRSLDEHDRVVYVGSFSKVVFPALRLGYVIVPCGLRDDVVNAKRYDDLGCNGIEQAAMASFMSTGGFDRHLRKASLELRRRRAALLDGLRRHCAGHLQVGAPPTGMHVIGWLPGWGFETFEGLLRLAHERGLGLHPIAPHYAAAPQVPGLLLGFAALSVAQLRAATAILGDCLAAAAAAPAPPTS
jgi:GntR family transcriptional regulator/MocR family aminotransferase